MDEPNPRHALRKPKCRIELERVLWYVAGSAPLIQIDILPKEFDSPMFWTEEELRELKGTEVVSRIGKLKSEEQYNQIILPVVSANPQLFDITKCDLEAFHRMGSLVLAYSFGRTDSSSEGDDDEDEVESAKVDLAMVPLADMLNANPQLNNVLNQPDFLAN